ncbi:MAG: hypothetical protein K2G13_05315, partial [Muribaculaceae bacterium]|nr:hypothetical protein [Muribaculaceae bacterium]
DVYSECFVDNGYFFGIREGLMEPLNISVENVEKGKVFDVANNVATFPNEFFGDYGIALVGQNNEIKEVLKSIEIQEHVDPDLPFRGYEIHFTNLKVTKDIEPTDRLQLVTRKVGEDTFRLMLGTIEHASYIGVTGNTPDLIKVKISVGPGINFEYRINTDKRIRLGAGEYEYDNVLRGLNFEFGCGPVKEEKDKTVILTLEGEYVYGDIQQFRIDDFFATSTKLYSDYDIRAKLYELKEESVVLETAGTLQETLSDIEKNSIRGLAISGKMNAVDFWYIRDYCPTLEYLDISKVDIEGVVAEDKKMTQFDRHPENEADMVPEFGLSSLKSLKKLLLPESLKGICDNALS